MSPRWAAFDAFRDTMQRNHVQAHLMLNSKILQRFLVFFQHMARKYNLLIIRCNLRLVSNFLLQLT
jgi:hypothetical protein